MIYFIFAIAGQLDQSEGFHERREVIGSFKNNFLHAYHLRSKAHGVYLLNVEQKQNEK